MRTTERCGSGRSPTSRRTTSSRQVTWMDSSTGCSPEARRSPNAASPSSPTGWSSEATTREASRSSMTWGSGTPLASASSSMVGSRPSSTLSRREAAAGEAALDRLADPQRRVGRELEALAPVELLRGADEAEHALLDEVEEAQVAGALVLLGDGDDEAEVGLDQLLLGIEITAL